MTARTVATRTAQSRGPAATATAQSAWNASWQLSASPSSSIFDRGRCQSHKRVDLVGDVAAVVRALHQDHPDHILRGIDPAVGAIRAAMPVRAERVQPKL